MTGPRRTNEARARRTNERGARPLGDDGEHRGKGWLWWLLGLLLLALIAIALISLLGGDDDDGDDSTTSSTSVTSEAGGPTPTESKGTNAGAEAGQAEAGQAEPGAATPAGAGGSGSGGSGKLTSGAASLLPIPNGGLEPYSGKPATGKSVAVESVVSDEGFWVGESEDQRVFVKLDIQGESPFKVKAGDVVDLQGKVTGLSGGAEALGLTKAEGADQLSSQGQYLTVTKLDRG